MNLSEGTYRGKGIGRRAENGMAGQGPMERQSMTGLQEEWPGGIERTRVDRAGRGEPKRMGKGKYVITRGRAGAGAEPASWNSVFVSWKERSAHGVAEEQVGGKSICSMSGQVTADRKVELK